MTTRSSEGRKSKEDLAGGYFLTLYTFKQDLEHLSSEYGLSDYRSNNPCELCPCNKMEGDWPMNYHNFNDSASWMRKCYTAAQWNAAHPEPHYLFEEKHITSLNVEPDEAHILHLGVSQYCLGSIMWLLCYSRPSLSKSPAENLQAVWQEVQAEYRRRSTPTQLTNMKIRTFTDPDQWASTYPKLRAKAAETKDLVRPLAFVWDRFCTPGDVDHSRISQMLHTLVELQQVLHDNKEKAILPLSEAIRFRRLVKSFLKDYSLMANAADREHVCLFSMVPKCHWLWHLGERALWINPRRSCCLLDEDFVGRMKGVVSSCSVGTALLIIQSKVAEQYCCGFFSRSGIVANAERGREAAARVGFF